MVSLRDLVLPVWISFGMGSVLYAVSATDYERMLIFKQPIPGKALPGHVIRTERVPDEGSCRVKCYMEPNCVSINVGPNKQGQLICELNNHTDETPSHSSLEERKHCIHNAVENFCHGDPCPKKISVCQVGFTYRGYRCACRKGYIEDHGQCEDIDECSMPDHGHCSPDANCINQPGSFECKCRPGYTGDGANCYDLNECYTSDANNCSVNADCVNKPGTFECNCKPGYTGDGVVCNDIDECKAESHNCSPCAICSNVPGSFGCSCKSEFTGDGKTCTLLCPSSSWTSYGSSCYKLFTTPQTWFQADAICRSSCGLLIKIDSAGENKFIENKYLAKRRVDYWIGLTDIAVERDWKWSDGTGLTGYENWGLSQPNDVNNQDCGGIRMGKYFGTDYYAQWHDNSCLEEKEYICEIIHRLL